MKIRLVGFSVLGVAVLVAGGLGLFAFDFPRPADNDMLPGLRKDDLLLACRICGEPRRGDVVLFASPDDKGELTLRRVAAVPGDTVEVERGAVRVNGAPLDDEPGKTVQLANIDSLGSAPRIFDEVYETLGRHRFATLHDAQIAASGDRPAEKLDGEYFLLADRRSFARDSRAYGPVERSRIRSIVLRVLQAAGGEADRQKKLP